MTSSIASTAADSTVVSPAQPQTWQIDPSHTLVEFSVRHMMVSTVKGRFPEIQGSIVLDDENPARSSVEVTLNAASVTTHDQQRDAHLRSADFFDADTFPSITFRSTR